MAEYYPLLSKAIGSLPSSTQETRRVVYERARKALIGQLRTLHPPVPDEDIEKESVELDRAIARLEEELASPAARDQEQREALPSDIATTPTAPAPVAPPAARSGSLPPLTAPTLRAGGALGPSGPAPFAPLRTKIPVAKPPPPILGANGLTSTGESDGVADLPPPPPPARSADQENIYASGHEPERPRIADSRGRIDAQRPFAPQPPSAKGPKRQMWIIWVGLGVVALIIGVAAFKLRDNPQVAAKKPAQQLAQTDNGKIAERIGNAPSPESQPSASPDDSQAAQPSQPTSNDQAVPAPQNGNNPAVPVAQRAALLMEAPDEPNKVKTFLGNVVWKLNNIAEGQGDPVGTGVEADIDMPDDKLKAVITFAKNTDSSLPASHTIKIHFDVQPGSTTGDVKQISVPQMRKEDSPSGEPLAGVTVPVVQNSFLVGLSPGNAESANLDLLRGLQWIDVPMLLANGKIAKLTFEKGAAGDRDINDAIAAWQKQ